MPLKVIVWLGESNHQIDQALDELSKIVEKSEQFSGQLENWDEYVTSIGMPVVESPIWKDIEAIFLRPWLSHL